ncbi:MAG: SO_0444 family Cu/Zn efflux transporter [Desulfuromonadales bacterium]|nr:SO_0444 family Cu/Zn efflux transporter [Desulfuromonadales bacterium]
MIDFFRQLTVETWHLFTDAAPYVIFGFLAAGLIKALLPEEAVARHLGGRSTSAVLKASLLGIPLPLCSCGVIPAAISLRKQGAGRGASAAFLVSTPESGVDSIAITWALLDPVMTVVRPIAAFLTGTLTGILINLLPEEKTELDAVPSACGCSDACCGPGVPIKAPLGERMAAGVRYAFGELLKDIGGWLLLGVLIAGLVTTLIPDGFFEMLFEHQAASLLVMLLVSIPLYMCASASTPIAAALVLKGLSPGAALVFLLAGPATNAATLTVVARFWGRQATLVYLAAIAFCSLVLGWLVNEFYAWAGLDISRWVTSAQGHAASGWHTLAAVVLLALILRAFWASRRSVGCCGE